MLFDNDRFEHNGRTFRVELPHETADPPWDREDGHGPVSDWTVRDKAPGERLLSGDGPRRRYYDFQEAIKIAKRDRWDAAPFGKGTKSQRAARAVEADFERLRLWCDGAWFYVGVIVHLVAGPARSAGLWGVESDAHDWIAQSAHELASEISAELDDEMAASIAASRPDLQPN